MLSKLSSLHCNKQYTNNQLLISIIILLSIIIFLLIGQLKYTFKIEYEVEILNVKGSSFHYNLWDSLTKLWNEKLYFLYFFLFIFSGIWPYIKLLLLYYIIIMLSGTYNEDSIIIKMKKKLKYLNWIADIGIWSFADIWVVVMISIVLNENKTISIDEETTITANLQVTPLDGVIVLFFGLFLSQLLNVIAIYWIQYYSSIDLSMTEYSSLGNIDSDDDYDSVLDDNNESFNMECQLCQFMMKKSIWCKRLCHVLYLTLQLFFVFGLFYLPLYEIKYEVIKQYTSVNQYTVFSGIMHLLKVLQESDNDNNNTKGQYFLFVISIIFVVVFPLLEQLLVSLTWFIPQLSSKSTLVNLKNMFVSSKKILPVLEFISHFCSLIVFLISSLFVSFELGSLLKNLALGKYLSIEIKILPAFYIYFLGVVVLSIAKHQIMDAFRSLQRNVATSLTSNPIQGGVPVSSKPLMSEYARGNSIVL